MYRLAIAFFLCAALSACATSTLDYAAPAQTVRPNSIVIDQDRDAVWAVAVPRLGKQFFALNTIDKTSGLINLSYSGDPEKYIDCGTLTIQNQSSGGTENIVFPGARSFVSYRLANPQGVLVPMVREMSLDGKINVIFEAEGQGKTRVTVNTRYVVQRRFTGLGTDTIGFNSASGAAFAKRGSWRPLECRANGEMEAEILRTIQGL